ncbi:MAG: DUF465 domain-containing protein [Deltaproteobacteria bacterium]|jgi:uncharacterized protein YdcH (DUF465 family)|nr:DUF465 domain-containing protein [Deltaproteobacteria bacterium]
MDPRDETLINQLVGDNPDLQSLVADHQDYERRLEEMNKRPYLSPEEDLERKKIQKAKLAGKDKIERILAAHRN